MAIEKKPIAEAYKYAYNRPEFPAESGLTIPKLDLTLMDTFAIPKSIVETEDTFKGWFEPRFFKLDAAGIQEFDKLCKDSVNTINSHNYLLSPRKGKDFPLSPSIAQRVGNGFKDITQIRNFFSNVSLDDNEPPERFLRPNRKSDPGAARLSICRILSIAYILDHIKRSNDLNRFIEYSRNVLGRSEKSIEEPGILASLVVPGSIDILDKPDGKVHMLEWLEKSQIFLHGNLVLGGPEKRRSHFIPEVHIGLKGGERAFLKTLRDPKSEFSPLDDFLRLRFIYKDNEHLGTIIDLLHDLQEEAKAKKNPLVRIEIKARNYFTPEDLKEYLPEEVGKREEAVDEESGDVSPERDSGHTILPSVGARIEKEVRRGGLLDKVTLYENISSGKNYRNITVKIYLANPETQKKKGVRQNDFFGFEIQLMRKKELISNEALERHSSHFLLEMRQAALAISRNNGPLGETALKRLLKNYLVRKTTEELPELLLGEAKYADKSGSKVLEMDFTGTPDKKAKDLFDFLVAEGTLRHVAPDFPTKKVPKRETRMTSGLYIHENTMSRILESLGYQKK